jgi:hypothetical protein
MRRVRACQCMFKTYAQEDLKEAVLRRLPLPAARFCAYLRPYKRHALKKAVLLRHPKPTCTRRSRVRAASCRMPPHTLRILLITEACFCTCLSISKCVYVACVRVRACVRWSRARVLIVRVSAYERTLKLKKNSECMDLRGQRIEYFSCSLFFFWGTGRPWAMSFSTTASLGFCSMFL